MVVYIEKNVDENTVFIEPAVPYIESDYTYPQENESNSVLCR